MKVERVPFPGLSGHMPPLALAYLSEYGRLAARYDVDYRDEQSLVRRAREAAKRPLDPSIGAALERRLAQLEAPAPAIAALAKLRKGAVAVVTGQQPGAALGPLYNLYKAITAIGLARFIDDRGVPAVAVFWNHSDDHHPGELGRVRFPGADGGIVDLTLPLRDDDAPLYTREPPELGEFVVRIRERLPDTPHRDDVSKMLLPGPDATLSGWYSQLMLAALGRHGLVVVEPRDLAGPDANRVLLRAVAEQDLVDRAVGEGARAFEALGFKAPLAGPLGTNVYSIDGGRRVRTSASRGLLSGGVAMRLIVQDAALPTAAYVGGPNEVGYIGQLKELYAAFGMTMPAIVPRISATLVEPRVARVAHKFGLRPDELFVGADALVQRTAAHENRGVLEEIERIGRDMEAALRGLGSADRALADAADKTVRKVQQALGAYRRRIVELQKQSDDVGRAQLEKLADHVTPGGVLQERVFTPVYYMTMFGPALVDGLLEALDPFAFQHQVVWL